MASPALSSRSPGVLAARDAPFAAWERSTGLAGIVFLLLLVLDVVLGSAPSDASAPGRVASFYATHGPTVLVATDLQIGIALAFVVFLGGLYGLLRRAESPPATFSTAALGLGLVTLCVVLLNQAVAVALAGAVARRVDPTVLWALFRVGGAIDLLSDLWHGLFLAAASVALLRTHLLPCWIGWTGLVGALGFILGTYAVGRPGSPLEAFLLPGFLGFLLWMLATSLCLVRGLARVGLPHPTSGAAATVTG